MAEATKQKWHGALKTTVKAPVDKAWAVAGNFCKLNEWLPTVEKCEKVEGEYQQPGCVRYVSGHTFPRPDGSASYANEKILSIDEANYALSYQMMENNFGLDEYVSTLKLRDAGNGMTDVDWSYVVNPVEKQTEEGLAQFMLGGYQKGLGILEEKFSSDLS